MRKICPSVPCLLFMSKQCYKNHRVSEISFVKGMTYCDDDGETEKVKHAGA